MSDQATIDEAVRKDRLDLPDLPVIETIEVKQIVDSSGVDSLEVWVVLSDSTNTDEEITGESVMQIKEAIAESLLESGVTLFPYIRFIKQSDYKARKRA